MPASALKTTVWILGDQLNPRISSLTGIDKSECVVLIVESLALARHRPYHKQKLVFIWSAMRHFAQELRELGYEIDYYEVQPSLKPGLDSHLKKYSPDRLRLMEPAEYNRSARLVNLVEPYGIHVEVTPNNMFLSERIEFVRSAGAKRHC